MPDINSPEADRIFNYIKAALDRKQQPGSYRTISQATQVPVDEIGGHINAMARAGHIIKIPSREKYDPIQYELPPTSAEEAGRTGVPPAVGAALAAPGLLERYDSESLKYRITLLKQPSTTHRVIDFEKLSLANLYDTYTQTRHRYNAARQKSIAMSDHNTLRHAKIIWASRNLDHPEAGRIFSENPTAAIPLPAFTCPGCNSTHDPPFADETCPACQRGL